MTGMALSHQRPTAPLILPLLCKISPNWNHPVTPLHQSRSALHKGDAPHNLPLVYGSHHREGKKTRIFLLLLFLVFFFFCSADDLVSRNVGAGKRYNGRSVVPAARNYRCEKPPPKTLANERVDILKRESWEAAAI